MYDKNMAFTGKHAEYMKKLAANFIETETEEYKIGLFKRNLDVYMIAPMVGLLYNRRAEEEKGDKTTIHLEQIYRETKTLEMNYRTVMLLHEKDTLSIEERIDRAFRYDGDDEKRKEGDEIFESYVRGGIEVLYEKLIKDAQHPEDYYMNLYHFVTDFHKKYNDRFSVDEIQKLCLTK